jgi:tetratricopeptide (TPR) repeat protein
MRSATPSSQAEFDVYLEALAVLRDGPLMAEAIIARIPQENDPRRLTKFALYAESLDQFAAAKKIYTVLLNKNPHSTTPLKQLGAIAYQEGKWADVRHNLARYLKTAEADWKSIFYYAEANYHLGENFEAQKYCLRAVKMIDQRDDPTHQMGIASAYCLNQLGKRQEAIVLYKKLAAQTDDDVLRARAHTALAYMNAVGTTETH